MIAKVITHNQFFYIIIMSSLPSNEKYVMFLNPTYFKKRIFKSVYKNIIKRLENKGIVLFNITDAVDELKRRHKNTLKYKTKVTFDDNYFPNVNTLYINLFAGKYYNDNIYNKKKVEKEREMLFLLAGKLGVKEICYETEVVETTITKINANLKAKGNISTNFTKTIQKSVGTKGEEYYINRGAPVYLKYDNLQEVEKNIEERMNANIFDYKFYKNSPKLENFVYKRYEFKMEKLSYTIESEDISDISFAVKAYFSYFMNYGIDISFDKNVVYNENVHYKLIFYTDDELKREFGKKKRDYLDKFYSIREYYDLIEDKDKAVHLITEYVMEFANNYHYIVKEPNSELYQPKIHNFSKHIQEFIKYSEPGTFEGLCHTFQSTSQIKNWINKLFLNNNMEIISEMNASNKKEAKEAEKTVELKYDDASVILPYEKKLDNYMQNVINVPNTSNVPNNVQNNVQLYVPLDLQSRLELLAKENNNSDKDEELSNIINNCRPNYTPTSLLFEEDPYINSYMRRRSYVDEPIQSSRELDEGYTLPLVFSKIPAPISPPPLPPRMNDYISIKSVSLEENSKIDNNEQERLAEEERIKEQDMQMKMAFNSFQFAMKQEEQYRLMKEQQHEEELMAKLDELKNRPPIIPSSRTTSITSINSINENQPPYPPPPPPNSSDI